MKKQLGGGVYYRGDESVENLFKEKREFIAKGAYSLVFLIDVDKKPFISTNYNTFGKNVKYILAKIGVVCESKNNKFKVCGQDIFSQTLDDVKNEVISQTECYELSNSYLQAICPRIIHSRLIEYDDFLKFGCGEITQFSSTLKQSSPVHFMISITLMEVADKCYTMSKYILQNYDETTELIKKSILFHNMARYAVIELALMGYIHRDLGLPNVLISPEYIGYYTGNPSLVGRPFLIDFSDAKKIEGLSDKISSILHGNSKTKFTDALIIIGNEEKLLIEPIQQMRYNNWEYSGPGNISGYGWMFTQNFFKTENKSDDVEEKIKKTNKILLNIHAQREMSKMPTIITFGNKRLNQLSLPVADEYKMVEQIFPIQSINRLSLNDNNDEFDEDDKNAVTITDLDDLFASHTENDNDKTYINPENNKSYKKLVGGTNKYTHNKNVIIKMVGSKNRKSIKKPKRKSKRKTYRRK